MAGPLIGRIIAIFRLAQKCCLVKPRRRTRLAARLRTGRRADSTS
jgi:hypothetical protein